MHFICGPVFLILGKISQVMKGNYLRITTILFLLAAISLLHCNAFPRKRSYAIPYENPTDTLNWSMDYLRKLLYSGGEWYVTDNTYRKSIKGVLNYAENSPVDTIVSEMNNLLSDNNLVFIFDRRPQDIKNLEDVPGYIIPGELEKQIEDLSKQIEDSLSRTEIKVPKELFDNAEQKAGVVPYDDPFKILSNKEGKVPAELLKEIQQSLAEIQMPDSVSPYYFDSLRTAVIDSCRLTYNESLVSSWRDSVAHGYRTEYIDRYIDSVSNEYKRVVENRNFDYLTTYNDSVVESVNDSIRLALKYLTEYAETDSVLLRVSNLSGEQSSIWTADRLMMPIRLYLKNEQQDSLGVILQNEGKGNIKVVIDDGVKFTRLSETQHRQIKLEEQKVDRSIKKVVKEAPVLSPWRFGGDASLGLTQTALANWSQGGESSMALLGIAKYSINYIEKKIKWENSLELRYGGNYTGTKGYVKNDDRIEFQSRFGYSAFREWYYSGDFTFKTQMAKGFEISGDTKTLLSKFMSPGYITMSLGLDYKPDEDLSIFLSPLTSRTTYVIDTVRIDQTNFGVSEFSKKLWEPGMAFKGRLKRQLNENIAYNTRLEIFTLYTDPFRKFNFNWENILSMQVTQYITAEIMAHILYDYNTKFGKTDANGDPVLDPDGNQVTERRWQFKELITVGFKYRL